MIGAEAIEHERPEGRRGQMLEGGHEGRHARIFLRRLAGKPIDHVPEDSETVLRAPLEETHVLECRHALSHETQDRSAEALDSRLDAVDARLAEQLHLVLPEVRLGFVEEAQVVAAVTK